ncbi:PLP-dependent cysteine synthase family protein [Streptomyces sp. NPDC056656]|uniref:PLP-dependent cysteine synthase family protein n=1 Tax=Streptomyces sp. NPDC056656 TaxID=3345895 RepID=UPI003696ABAB
MIEATRSVEAQQRVVDSPDELVGHTPLLRLRLPKIREDVRLLAKLEMFHPLSSVKDRAALRMLLEAERSGALPATGGTVVGTTSGNTGISLAALCAVRGHRCVLVMPDNAGAERRAILRSFGAEIAESPCTDGLPAAIELGERIHRELPGSRLVAQHRNPADVLAHYETTGPEIWDGRGGEVDAFVCGAGIGGTLTGSPAASGSAPSRRAARCASSRWSRPGRRCSLAARRARTGSPASASAIGLGGGSINPVTDVSCIDRVVAVGDEDATQAVSDLARHYGLPAGISSGAVLHA